MSKFAHVLLHVALILVQVANLTSGMVPGPWQPVVAGASAALQGVIAIVNHKN